MFCGCFALFQKYFRVFWGVSVCFGCCWKLHGILQVFLSYFRVFWGVWDVSGVVGGYVVSYRYFWVILGCFGRSIVSSESRRSGRGVPWAAGRSSCCRRKALSLRTITCSGAPQPCVTAGCRRWNSFFSQLCHWRVGRVARDKKFDFPIPFSVFHYCKKNENHLDSFSLY